MIKVRCPICDLVMQGQGPAEWPQLPFCSDRCRLVDLGRWLGETYRVPAPTQEEEDSVEAANEETDNP